MPHAAITGWGMAVPDRVLTNAELTAMTGFPEEKIFSLTGIRERRVVGPQDTAASLATEASARALSVAGIDADDLDLIVAATAVPEEPLVPLATQIQANIGGHAGTFDTRAASTGFVTALTIATQYIRNDLCRRVLVVGSDALTRYVDYTDASTCILFGDGAGAVVIEASDAERGLVSSVMGADGSGHDSLSIPGIARRLAGTTGKDAPVSPYLRMNGGEVYRFAVRKLGDVTRTVAQRAGIGLADVDMIIPHQANLRIIDAAMRRLKLPIERVRVNLERYGNTTSASVPIALAEAADDGSLREGSAVALVGFGAGLTWAAGLVRWGIGGVTRLA